MTEAARTTAVGAGTDRAGARPAAAVRLVPFDALSAEELDAWHRYRAADPRLDSPYFHPGFAAAVHASGHPVEVAVGRTEHGEVCALLPCHRKGARLVPAGWPGTDFQGPVLAPGATLPPLALLSGGIRGFAFDHLLAGYPEFQPWTESTRVSPYVDATGGLDGYLGRASRSGRDNMGQARRRAAKAARTYGAVRFEADTVDDAALDRVVEFKRAQYAATGARDYFAVPGRVELLRRLLHTRDTSFGGVLSTLHAGPHLVAAHFGVRSGAVLHWWFPTYDPRFSALAPGWMLLREIVAAAPALGITRIDLGRGDDEYKRRAKTGEVLVGQGVVSRNPAGRIWRRTRTSVLDAARSSALGRQAARRIRALTR